MAANDIGASTAAERATAGIVLSGGRSRRMGTDKGRLVVDGLAMLDRAVLALRDAGVAPIVIPGSDDLPDPESDRAGHTPQGPLAGIVSGWNHLRATSSPATVMVLSCDLPAITGHVVREVIAASTHCVHGALAHDGERPQPLIAAYHASALNSLTSAFIAGERSVRRCFDGWDLGIYQVDRSLVLDADTPADLDGFDVEWPSR